MTRCRQSQVRKSAVESVFISIHLNFSGPRRQAAATAYFRATSIRDRERAVDVAKMSATASAKGKGKEKPVASLMAGALAGGVEAFVTYPLESLKTQLQFGSLNGGKVSHRTEAS